MAIDVDLLKSNIDRLLKASEKNEGLTLNFEGHKYEFTDKEALKALLQKIELREIENAQELRSLIKKL